LAPLYGARHHAADDFVDGQKIDTLTLKFLSIVLTATDWVTPVQTAIAGPVQTAIAGIVHSVTANDPKK
jgi:hypothetical protein